MHFTTFATLPAPFLHLHQSATSSVLNSILLMLPLACFLHFIFSQPCLHFPSTSCTIVFIKTSSSSRLKTRPYHFTSFTLASLSAAFFNLNMYISSTVLLLLTNFTPHITLTIDLFALLKIATSFSLKHQVSPPYNIVDLT